MWTVYDAAGKASVSILTPLTTKGDLFTFDTQNQRIGVGATNSYLRASSGAATGLAYSGPSAATPQTVSGSAGSAGTVGNPPAADDHSHQHASITTGDLHPEYTREAVLTAKGSLYAATGAGVPADLPVGADGTILVADATATPGVAWKTGQFRLTGRTVINQGTTSYTVPAGTKAILIECIGAGGGGGGVTSTITATAVGGGGGSGAYSAFLKTSPKLTAFTVAVGAGGAGGANTGGTGTTGGDTTFDSPSICTAKGGVGGVGQSVGTTAASAPTMTAGGLGGASSGGVGDVKTSGAVGLWGLISALLVSASGIGGSALGHGGGGGGQARMAASAAGNAGGPFGGGGGGASSSSGGAAAVGGAGADGVVIVWELS